MVQHPPPNLPQPKEKKKKEECLCINKRAVILGQDFLGKKERM